MASDGRIALVTGAGSGIGRTVAPALQADGYAVVLAGRRAAPLDETTAKGTSSGGRMLACPTDVADPTATRRRL